MTPDSNALTRIIPAVLRAAVGLAAEHFPVLGAALAPAGRQSRPQRALKQAAPAELAGAAHLAPGMLSPRKITARRIGRLAGRLSGRGLEAASPLALTGCAAHSPGRPLQRQGHLKIVSNRFAETIFRTHP